uniref:Beta-carotene isomerase D27-like C-terminal domain-containing protein n=1 Tax=Kalanchoe fedtschenkoi TaxID=63787 RepID=A0A7N0TTG2_KALFE
MRLSALPPYPVPSCFTNNYVPNQPKPSFRNRIFRRVACNSGRSESTQVTGASYKLGVFDDVFLNVFRAKMVKEVGWDSEQPGYDGLIEVATHMMMKFRNNSDTKDAAVRILVSLFPSWLLELYKKLIAPLGGGQVAAVMVARVTAITCQWLMGPCTINSVDLDNGSSWQSGVYVEKCKYLEESKC